ncbi:MAG: hypothetical protein ACXVZV_06340 [Terriglobales bacterium]
MKNYLITAGLLFALSGVGALAQNSSTTPGVPAPNDPHTYPNPQATAPDQTSPDQQTDADRDQDRSNSDQQQYPDTPSARDHINDNGQSTSDREKQSGDMDHDRQSDRDRTPQDNNRYPQAGDRENQYPQAGDRDRDSMKGDRHDRANDSTDYGDHDRDRVSGNGYRDQIQSALQQANLNDVSVNDSGSRIELNGTVPTARDAPPGVAHSAVVCPWTEGGR